MKPKTKVLIAIFLMIVIVSISVLAGSIDNSFYALHFLGGCVVGVCAFVICSMIYEGDDFNWLQ